MRERAAELGGTLDVTAGPGARDHRARPPPAGGAMSAGAGGRGRRPPASTADGVADALSDAEDIDVVGTAADGEAAVAAVAEMRPDVVLMDLRMPGGGGLPATTAIAARHPAPPSSC